MKVSKLIIKNFRSFGSEMKVINLEDITAFIGSNSSGKTTILQALLKLFGTTIKEKQLQRSDFHLSKDVDPESVEELDLSIEAVITFPEIEGDGDIFETVPVFFNQMVIHGPGIEPHVRIRLQAKWVKGLTIDGDIEQKLQYVLVSENEQEEEKHLISVLPHDRSQIQVLYVPAQRDPTLQLKNASGTILSRILKGVNWREDMDNEIKERMGPVEELFRESNGFQLVKETLNEQWNMFHRDIRYTKTDLSFQAADLSSLLKRTEVEFSPTEIQNSYKVDQLGDGLRSLFYFSLVSSLLELEYKAKYQVDEENNSSLNMQSPALTILAVEEPENHVSPHLLGRVMKNFDRLANHPNAQVLITSHSPSLVKRVLPESMRYVRISTEIHCTSVSELKLPTNDIEAYKYIKGAVQIYPELYFARLVVLGEGESEQVVLPRVFETLGHSLDTSGISFVPLGGRHVNHLWRLLNSLDIPHVTLLDLDRERSGGGWGRIKYVIEQLVNNGHKWEEILCIQNENGDTHIMTPEEFEGMLNWNIDVDLIDSWVTYLGKYDVFFSSPLDLDFMMLNSYPQVYTALVPKNGGPRIPKEGTSEFQKRLEKDIRATLKPEGGDGATYSEDELKLMTWYNYLFLGRGKPSTHMQAINEIDNDLLVGNLPKTIKVVFDRIKDKLSTDPYSDFAQ